MPLSLQQTNRTITVGAFKTGKGTNVAILTNDTEKALYGQFDNTYWTFNGFEGTYSLYMSSAANSTFASKCDPLSGRRKRTPPNKGTNARTADYGNVGINSGYTTPGFSEGDEDGLLVWNNTDMANVGSFFALCPRVIPGYENKGVQAQVFWQSNEAPSEGTKDCKPIVIHGAYENSGNHH